MVNRILTALGWEARIRSKMGVLEPYLPDADIQAPECISVAEANIIKQVPDYATLTGDDLIYLEAAVVCECAVLLCPGMPGRLPVKEQGPSMTHELQVDWAQRKIDFENERNGYVGSISTQAAASSLTHFSVSSPCHDNSYTRWR
jgi:hypothetical protein